MTREPLLEQLVQAARVEKQEEEGRIDERWDRLAAGTLSPAEAAELEALAGESEEARRRYEAFAPLDAGFRAHVVQQVREQLGDVDKATHVADSSPPLPQLPRTIRAFRSRRALALGGTLAASLAALVFVLVDSERTSAPLPPYVAELEGGDRPARSQGRVEAGTHPVFSRGSRFGLVLRPETAVSGKIAVGCWLQRGEALEPWQPAHEISQGGAARIEGTVGRDIEIASGAWTLWAVVGRPGRLPDTAELDRHLDEAPLEERDWTLLRADFTVELDP